MINGAGHLPLAVGVTGGIGSGKTEVCNYFTALGATFHSADTLAKSLLNTHAGIRRGVIAAFGEDVYGSDGTINRKQLAKRAFGHEDALRKLNQIVHPIVIEELRAILKREKEGRIAPLIVVEAALIYEAGIEDLFDYVIVVSAPESTRIGRVAGRDGVAAREVRERIRAQLPAEELVKRADFVIQNSGDLASLHRRCDFLFSLLTRISPPPEGERL